MTSSDALNSTDVAGVRHQSGEKFACSSGNAPDTGTVLREYPESPVIAIVGPTGSGKSELGIRLAQEMGGEIVNCDSIQICRELNIGSAKLPESARGGVPHHLLDAVSFREELTAGDYSRLARVVIRDIHARGKLPIIVGGTGFYLRALLQGLSPAPGRDPQLRSRLDRAASRHPDILSRLLRRLDPVAAGRIHRNDRPKLIRAIEISVLAQMPASLAQSTPRDSFSGIRTLKIGLNPVRHELYERLNNRVAAMFASGLLDETRDLLAELGGNPIPRALQSLGYKQALDVLLGRSSVAEAIDETQTRTRQYAKRQLTWFRADPDICWISQFGDELAAQQMAFKWSTQFARCTSPCSFAPNNAI